jgi:hypothetical protein
MRNHQRAACGSVRCALDLAEVQVRLMPVRPLMSDGPADGIDSKLDSPATREATSTNPAEGHREERVMWNEYKARTAALAGFRESLSAKYSKDTATSVAFARYRRYMPGADDFEIRTSLARGLAMDRVAMRVGRWRTWLGVQKAA